MPDDPLQGVQLEADSPARSAVTKAAALNWPMPADRRLDQLVDLANSAGAGTRRNELAAAIIAAAAEDPEVLLQLVLRWRRTKVVDVLVAPEPKEGISTLR